MLIFVFPTALTMRSRPIFAAHLTCLSSNCLNCMWNTIVGSTTACLVSFDTSDNRLHTVNLGDSGYMVVRNGRVLARSQEQQHYFNTPFQLTLVPPSYRGRVLSDRYVISACIGNIHTFRV